MKTSDYVMVYLHPRDFDYDQPMIEGLSAFRRFKSYVGLKTTANKLDRLLNDFDFVDLREANKSLDWSQVKVIKLDGKDM